MLMKKKYKTILITRRVHELDAGKIILINSIEKERANLLISIVSS